MYFRKILTLHKIFNLFMFSPAGLLIPTIKFMSILILTVLLYFIGTNNITKVARNVHEGSVFSICALKEGSIITGGGKDGRLMQFDTSMHPTGYEAQVNYYYNKIKIILSNYLN